jgi:hypothetical protein
MPSHNELSNTGLVLKRKSHNAPIVISLFDFETRLSPLLVMGSGRWAMLLPIRERYAEELLGGISRQKALFAANEALLHVEKAYFSKPSRAKLVPIGTPIVFYVSGAQGGRKEGVGVARTTFAALLSVEEARLKLARQGVLSEVELREVANERGLVSAIVFDNFTPFRNPIPYPELQAMGCVTGSNLVTAQRVPYAESTRLICTGLSGASA